MTNVVLGEIGKKLAKLTKMVQNLSDKFTKDTESMKRNQTEITEIKNGTEFVDCRNDQCDDSVAG